MENKKNKKQKKNSDADIKLSNNLRTILDTIQNNNKKGKNDPLWTDAACCRRLTIFHLQNMSNTPDYIAKATDKEINNYLISRDSYANFTCYDANNRPKIEVLPFAYEPARFSNYMTGKIPVPLYFVVDFIKYFKNFERDLCYERVYKGVFDTSLEDDIDKINFYPFLNDMFGDNRYYHYDLTNENSKPYFEDILSQEKIYAYFPPLSSDRGKRREGTERESEIKYKGDVPWGELQFSEVNGICEANFKLKVNSQRQVQVNEQTYSGFLVISESCQCAYCWFYENSKHISELFFLSFRMRKLVRTPKPIVFCAVAEAISTSALDNRPTAHRMLLCSKKLDDDFVRTSIWPLLKLNSKYIYIDVENLEEMKKKSNFSAKVEEIISKGKLFITCEIEDYWSAKHVNENTSEAVNFLIELRKDSINSYSNKVSQHVDSVVEFLVQRYSHANDEQD